MQVEELSIDALWPLLEAKGFRRGVNHLASRGNGCDWYAYRRSQLEARECGHNEGKQMQLVVWPFKFIDARLPRGAVSSVEVEVCGELGGVWFKLRAYSVPVGELIERLPSIERSLIAAWNALEAG